MDNLTLSGITMGTVNSGITKGTTSTYTTTATTAGFINGKYVTGLAAQTNTATPTTDAATGAAFVAVPINKASVYVFGTKADSTIQVCQGSVVPTQVGVTTTAGAFINPPQFPALPDDFMVLGYVLVRAAPSASSWTFGTSSWTATGITASTVVPCAVLPARPQTS